MGERMTHTLTECYEVAEKRGISRETADTWLAACMTTTEERVRAMQKLFEIVDAADTVTLRGAMLGELAYLLRIPAHAVFEDYRTHNRNVVRKGIHTQ